MTYIDPARVNVLESDIEDFLFDNPDLINIDSLYCIEHWVARQFKVPSGIIDLIGVSGPEGMHYKYLIVVEVKNTPINSSALTQVTRYAGDLKRVMRSMDGLYQHDNWDVLKVVVGQSIDDTTFREAEAMGIAVNVFDVNLSLRINKISWKRDFLKRREEQDREVSASVFIAEFKQSLLDYMSRRDEEE